MPDDPLTPANMPLAPTIRLGATKQRLAVDGAYAGDYGLDAHVDRAGV